MTTSNDHPVACSLDAGELRDRERRWRAVSDTALRGKTATAGGVRLEFAADVETAHVLLDLVAAERSCCGWASWTLTSTAASTLIEASADGPGTPVLQAMFGVTP